ncbi:DUF4166 domain-containing protein [Aquincola sp. S2]|uniref:DUF4166 domain-containing protein n=1 Tax=Pseudaquabacterium terrae TaxID=2732868 RepID=A0ABX2EBI6_9BURK|nr:DUF4166 domain-containing protein [Aquabacterium terrae]NRF65913.1 DUF4166 domain-containing protein [Aquabacterium terrae]
MSALSPLLPARRRSEIPPVRAPLDLAALVGAEGWSRLPPAVRRRFAAGHGDALYTGRTDLRCSRIGRVFAWLARLVGAPLTGLNVNGAPTTVQVHDDGRGGMVWERHFDGSAQVVRSTKEIDARSGELSERTDGGLSMALDVFEEDGALVFRSRRYWLAIGRLRLPVPALLSPGICRVTHTNLGFGFFRFTLSMVHPLWGETFHQSGVFADPDERAGT